MAEVSNDIYDKFTLHSMYLKYKRKFEKIQPVQVEIKMKRVAKSRDIKFTNIAFILRTDLIAIIAY